MEETGFGDFGDEARGRIAGGAGSAQQVAWSPDGTRIASASKDRTLRLWDAATGTPLVTLVGHEGEVHSVAFRPDGVLLASASEDRTARLWDARSG